jgi:hypothetical protein
MDRSMGGEKGLREGKEKKRKGKKECNERDRGLGRKAREGYQSFRTKILCMGLMTPTSKFCLRYLGQASYLYRPVTDPGVEWRMHLPPVKMWLIESVNFCQHQWDCIDAGCQADSADSMVEDGQRHTMRAH